MQLTVLLKTVNKIIHYIKVYTNLKQTMTIENKTYMMIKMDTKKQRTIK